MALGKRAQIHSSESGFLGTRGKMDPGSQAARNMRTNGSKHLITGTFSHHQKFPAQRQTKPPMKCSSMSSISTSSFQHTNRFHLFPNPRIPKSHADPAARKPRAVGGNVNAASQVRHTYRLHCWPQVHKDGPSWWLSHSFEKYMLVKLDDICLNFGKKKESLKRSPIVNLYL